MPIMTELVVSIIGGVITAFILERLGGGRSQARIEGSARHPATRGGSLFGELIRILFAVGGGVAIAMIGGRMLIQAGIMPKGVGGRYALLVVGTILCWLLLAIGRRR